MSDMVFSTTDWGPTLFAALLRARWRHGWRYPVLEDTSGVHLDYMKLVAGALVLGRKFAALTEPGERVGVLVPNVNAAAVVFFALQAFGRVPAMLNFSAGPANLEAAVVTAQIKLVISSGEFVAKAKLEPVDRRHRRPRQVPLARGPARPDLAPPTACAACGTACSPAASIARFGLGRDDPAVVLFTSGSEGRPKGVVLSHGNILANCAQISARVDFNQQDKVFNALPVFHSFGLTGAMLLPVLGGVAVYMYPSPLHYRIVPELVYDSNATIIFGTNSFLKGYGRMGDPYDFRSLRYAFAGAEAIQDETQQLWFDKFGMRILTGYGATETAPGDLAQHAHALSLGHGRPPAARRSSTGWSRWPAWTAAAGSGSRAPTSCWATCATSSRACSSRPRTAGTTPATSSTSTPQGFVTILGRAKRFAKIGGEMVSLAAVEDFVHRLSPDHAHAVVALPDPRKGERIVLVTTDQALERDALLKAARDGGVNELMLPAEVIHRPELPLLGTGKTDYPSVQKIVTGYLAAA